MSMRDGKKLAQHVEKNPQFLLGDGDRSGYTTLWARHKGDTKNRYFHEIE